MVKNRKEIMRTVTDESSVVNRRTFMKSAGYIGMAVAGAMVVGCNNTSTQNPVNSVAPVSNDNGSHGHISASANNAYVIRNRGLMFISNLSEAKALAYAAERIFPADKNGPGALELCVVYFIDNQCAGGWGNHAREYMQGSFKEGVPGQGYQSPVYRKDVIKQGARALNLEAQKRHNNDFASLTGSQQDEILKDMESGKVIFESGVSSKYFFNLLKTLTIAGVFSDPIYNGNKDMAGWKMKRYPGAQMAYMDTIMEEKFQEIPPMSLSDMQGIE